MPRRHFPPGQESSVQSSFTITLPLAEGADPADQTREATEQFYEMAGRSCEVVLATVATRCEIQSINTNFRAESFGGRKMVDGVVMPSGPPSRVTLTGQIFMKVTFKQAASPAP